MTIRNRWFLSSILFLAAACGGDRARTQASEPTAVVAPAPVAERALLAERRAEQIERLQAYRLAGEFSTDERGYPTGVFKDAGGRRCPMAHLIHMSGRDDLVDETARTNNRLLLADVHDGPLMAWMLDSGLTQEEIVMVQGVMELDYGQLRFENAVFVDQEALIAAAREEVGKRIDLALQQLRDHTDTSLEVAVARR